MAGCWLIHSQSAELSDITRLALPQKTSNDDPVHKQMIYFRKEKKKPVVVTLIVLMMQEPQLFSMDFHILF